MILSSESSVRSATQTTHLHPWAEAHGYRQCLAPRGRQSALQATEMCPVFRSQALCACSQAGFGLNQGHAQVEILSPLFDKLDRLINTGNYGLPDTALVNIIQP